MIYNIVFVTGGLNFNGGTLEERALGGSETALICTARELKKLGHNVTVFCNCDEQGIYDNVAYFDISLFKHFIESGECDILIVSRFYDFFKSKINSKLNILWNHDILMEKAPLISVTYNIDYMYCLSNFHKQQYIEKLPELETHIKIINNGVDTSLLKNEPIGFQKKHKIMFTSRPERGLFEALNIYEKFGDKNLEFLVCNYPTVNDPKVHEIEDVCYSKMQQLGKEGFNIQQGSFTKDVLYNHISESKCVIYPTEFPEIFCISAIEAQMNSTVFLTVDDFAMQETVGYSGIKRDKDFKENYITELRNILDVDEYREKLEEIGKQHCKNYTWELTAKQFITDAEKCFNERTIDKDKIIDRLIYDSDLVLARKLAIETQNQEKIAFLNNALRYVDDPSLLKAIYEDEETHEKIDLNIEELEKNARFKWVSEQIQKHKITSILDFACHMGNSSILTSNRNPNCRVVGYDLSKKAIDKAKIRKEKYATYPDNLEFVNSLEEIESIINLFGKFDAIFIGEYLEHVIDPESELIRMEKYVKKGGKVFFTVPRGSWEFLSHLGNLEKDVYYHVHCFDANDIQDMVSHKPDFNCQSIRLMTGAQGEQMGNYMIQYTKDESSIHYRNEARKLYMLRPYAGISACIIAKDCEKEIERMIDSINFEVDEILVALDHKPGENKKLEKRIRQYKKAKIFYMPKKISLPDFWGFANARNFICSKAKYDWILWIDSDELLIKTTHLRRYIDNEIFNAFVIRQHHAQFDNFTEADKPSRLYRKSEGEFYGYIHEQVMHVNDINAPVHPSLIIEDAHIINFGEINELTRRKKCLDRNLPLLYEDIKYNVDIRKKDGLPYRKLSIILLMRDFLNRMTYAYEAFKTYQCKDVLELSLPKVEALYNEYFKNEDDMLYKNLAFNILQKAWGMVEKGDKIDISIGDKKVSVRVNDFDLTEVKKILTS